LRAEEFEGGSRVAAWSEGNDEDEFEQTLEREDVSSSADHEDDDETPSVAAPSIASRRYLSLPLKSGSRRLRVELTTGICDGDAGGQVTFAASDDVSKCPGCNKAPDRFDPRRGAMRPAVAGSPFLMAQITPGFLADLSPEPAGKDLLPFASLRSPMRDKVQHAMPRTSRSRPSARSSGGSSTSSCRKGRSSTRRN
jgi:hypothetical protein